MFGPCGQGATQRPSCCALPRSSGAAPPTWTWSPWGGARAHGLRSSSPRPRSSRGAGYSCRTATWLPPGCPACRTSWRSKWPGAGDALKLSTSPVNHKLYESSAGPLAVLVVVDHQTSGNFKPWSSARFMRHQNRRRHCVRLSSDSPRWTSFWVLYFDCFEYFIFKVLFLFCIFRNHLALAGFAGSLSGLLWLSAHMSSRRHLVWLSEIIKVHETSQRTTPRPVWAVTALDEWFFEYCILNILFIFSILIFMLRIRGSSCTSWLWYASALQALSLGSYDFLPACHHLTCDLVSSARFVRHHNRQPHCLSEQRPLNVF